MTGKGFLENQTSPASPDDQNTNDPQQTDPRHPKPLEYMASHTISGIPVGADLSRTPPIYRPSLAFRYSDEKVKKHYRIVRRTDISSGNIAQRF